MIGNLNTIRAGFMRRASAPNINPLALKVAYLIAFKYFNKDTGTARPSQETLARDLNVKVRTVQRMLDVLRPLGLVIVPGHGPNRSSTYRIDLDKATPPSPVNTTPVSSIGSRKGDSRRQKRRHLTTEKATPKSLQLKKENQEEYPRGGANAPPHWERERGSLALTFPAGALSPAGGAHQDEKKLLRQEVIVPGDRLTELRAIWSRPWVDNDEAAARRAFAEACRQTETDEIIAAAQAWVVVVEARFLPLLSKWLTGRGWEKVPPQRRQRKGAKPALAEMMLRRGQA